MAQETKKTSVIEKLVPVLVILSIGLAFMTGTLWQKVKNIEGNKKADSVAVKPTEAPLKVNVADVDQAGEPFVGSEDAPLTIAYWSDYQCPFCKRFEQDTLSTLYEKYVKTGKVKLVFKDFQFLGPDSQTAGLMEHAVWELYPENFLGWQEKMMEKQDAENSGWGKKADIVALVSSMGMDGAKVLKLVEEKKDEYQKEMDADKLEAAKFGITGTPGFVIGEEAVYGAETLTSFESRIDSQLGK